MTGLWLGNVAAFSIQLAVVVASALLAAALLRLRAPRPALRSGSSCSSAEPYCLSCRPDRHPHLTR